MFLDDITKSLCSLVSLDDSIKKKQKMPNKQRTETKGR